MIANNKVSSEIFPYLQLSARHNGVLLLDSNFCQADWSIPLLGATATLPDTTLTNSERCARLSKELLQHLQASSSYACDPEILFRSNTEPLTPSWVPLFFFISLLFTLFCWRKQMTLPSDIYLVFKGFFLFCFFNISFEQPCCPCLSPLIVSQMQISRELLPSHSSSMTAVHTISEGKSRANISLMPPAGHKRYYKPGYERRHQRNLNTTFYYKWTLRLPTFFTMCSRI